METKQKKSSASRKKTSGSRAGAKSASSRAQSGGIRTGTSRNKRPVNSGSTKRKSNRSVSSDVVYTPPKPFNRTRLLLGLATTVAVVLALIFSLSIFFKVEHVIVSGAEKYDAWTVMEASGIETGDNLLGISEPRIAGKIQGALSYVDQVRVGIKLPDTVNIEIKELDVWYSIQDVYRAWWLMTSDGRIVEQVDAATAGDCTQILGVQLKSPVVGQLAVAAEAETVVDENGETIPVTVTGSDRLNAALSILEYLELNEVIGEMISVDVTYMSMIELWYAQQQFQINLGDTTQLNYKIYCMKKVIDTLPEYETGQIDVSFMIVENQPVYSSFD